MKKTMQRLLDLEAKTNKHLKAKVYYSNGETAIKIWYEIFLCFIKQKVSCEADNPIIKLVWLSDPTQYDNGVVGRYLIEAAQELNDKRGTYEKNSITH